MVRQNSAGFELKPEGQQQDLIYPPQADLVQPVFIGSWIGGLKRHNLRREGGKSQPISPILFSRLLHD
jgi:hypothetical protein